MRDSFGFELESVALHPELEQELELHETGPYGALAGEGEWEQPSDCPVARSETVSGFSRYQPAVSSLPPNEQEKLRNLARLIVSSFRPGCQPVLTVRLTGHADRDWQRGPDFENQISRERALAVRGALIQLINNPAITSRISWQPSGAGASAPVVRNAQTEAERARNRRADIGLVLSATPVPTPTPQPTPPPAGNPCLDRCWADFQRCLKTTRFPEECIARLSACQRGCLPIQSLRRITYALGLTLPALALRRLQAGQLVSLPGRSAPAVNAVLSRAKALAQQQQQRRPPSPRFVCQGCKTPAVCLVIAPARVCVCVHASLFPPEIHVQVCGLLPEPLR